MQLKIGNINITDIQFGKETKVEKGVLYVNKEQVMAAVADERLTNITLELARPGESVRIMPVKDVIEPRLKIEGNGGVFPGFVNKVDMVGSGTTLVLRGAAVVTAGSIVGFQEGIIDMSGPGQTILPSPSSTTLSLSVKRQKASASMSTKQQCAWWVSRRQHVLLKQPAMPRSTAGKSISI